ncbi:urease subunit beta [Stackebrandtia endophytica]|uniref:Urease subunit beta n=1 Tax=Stackebrandtia endophytica TaxID=1496996 RepID=A0A543AVM9_9ACTN|nr:urease subunit beta [Stackebrandtia endophytica]TQL76635.1 urease subunit beta [Stackebrandtia endophytica]
MIPGEIYPRIEPVEINVGRESQQIVIVNNGDRPIQIGSHIHLPDTNPALEFKREEAEGYRLDIEAGKSIRFEPGVSKIVDIVEFGGDKTVPGLQP